MWKRKWLRIGPKRPCGSTAKGISIMFWRRRSPMTESPVIFDDGSELLILLLRMYFFLSNFWRCLSAMAVTEEIAVSKDSKVEAFALCAMVMSIPMVEYGQAVWISSDIVGSGSKDISKGCAEISLVFVFFFSISS